MIQAGSILNVLYRDGEEDPIGIFITVEGAKKAAIEDCVKCDRYDCETDHHALLTWEAVGDAWISTQKGIVYYIEPRILLP